ncbi:Tfp pilus assembly protein FimT/FimU [Stenotrophomonas sp. HITSZ_GD]|uniref:pilus assembly FimT family protein n=1 Tax=Stenotrophomonas sp. HITSZ_GD TaxID=3037248 RepID=UPI00240DB83D|nr:Tfp pilus assembly protein FimT/FimU [Stenotrophomonas sp. HITSZ_GD]MDG2524560.1 Tfp pilus assembly protein FimT/FimU [Stenotrophomonas sp. HITSZ_GD]
MPCRSSRGFTLVELMVTIAVLAILVAIAFPSFEATFRSNRVATTNNALLSALSMARSEAVRNTRGGGVCASADGEGCNGNWSNGWIAFADNDGSGDFTDGDTVINFTQLNPKMEADGDGVDVIAFNSRGMRVSTADQAIVLRPTTCGGQELQRTVNVSPTGTVRVTKGNCP